MEAGFGQAIDASGCCIADTTPIDLRRFCIHQCTNITLELDTVTFDELPLAVQQFVSGTAIWTALAAAKQPPTCQTRLISMLLLSLCPGSPVGNHVLFVSGVCFAVLTASLCSSS